MRERFNTTSGACVKVDDVELSYDRVSFRAEGIAPGDCRKYFDSDDRYEAMRDTLRPSFERIVYEVRLTFEERVPDLLDALDETGGTFDFTFDYAGHRIENVSGQVQDVDDDVVIISGEYSLQM